MTKLTQKHFDYFKSRCDYWQRQFGATDWEAYFEWTDRKDVEALCKTHYNDRTVTFMLPKEWHSPGLPTDKNLDKSAFHEIQEVILSDLKVEAEGMGLSEEFLGRLIHQIIRKWENYVFKP